MYYAAYGDRPEADRDLEHVRERRPVQQHRPRQLHARHDRLLDLDHQDQQHKGEIQDQVRYHKENQRPIVNHTDIDNSLNLSHTVFHVATMLAVHNGADNHDTGHKDNRANYRPNQNQTCQGLADKA